jgi:hypothetical protein
MEPAFPFLHKLIEKTAVQVVPTGVLPIFPPAFTAGGTRTYDEVD